MSGAIPQSSHALEAVQGFFTEGTLGDKHAAALQLRNSGDTTFFDGAVRWSVFVMDAEQRLRGNAASLDDAFADMAAALALLIRQHGEAARVLCSVEREAA